MNWTRLTYLFQRLESLIGISLQLVSFIAINLMHSKRKVIQLESPRTKVQAFGQPVFEGGRIETRQAGQEKLIPTAHGNL